MRILIVNSEYPPIGGGAGNATANIARCLVAAGHEVTVLTAHLAGLPLESQENGVRIIRVRAARRREDRSNAFEQLVFILAACLRVLRVVPRSSPQVTLAFFGMPSGAVTLFIKGIFKIPYVVSLRGGDVPGFRPYDFKTYHRLIAPFLRVIWRGAGALVANSEGLRALAMAFDARFPISVVPNGVDASQYPELERDWSRPQILSAGRVVFQKGFDVGMQALAQLRDVAWEWRIAGDGPQLDTLKALANQLGIADRVTFLGWQARADLVGWYHRSNLFLFPSRHEGMPNAVLEAMADGLPVIATKIAGSEELVIDGRTGLLAASEDVESLRAALRRLLLDAKAREQMGDASRERVRQQYTWESVARQYADLLEPVRLQTDE